MFISCPKISIFLVKTTRETASAELVPSLQFVQKLAQVSSVYRLRSVLICQKSPPSGHLEKSVSPNPDPWDHLIDQIPTLCPTPPPPPSGLTLIGALCQVDLDLIKNSGAKIITVNYYACKFHKSCRFQLNFVNRLSFDFSIVDFRSAQV